MTFIYHQFNNPKMLFYLSRKKPVVAMFVIFLTLRCSLTFYVVVLINTCLKLLLHLVSYYHKSTKENDKMIFNEGKNEFRVFTVLNIYCIISMLFPQQKINIIKLVVWTFFSNYIGGVLSNKKITFTVWYLYMNWKK